MRVDICIIRVSLSHLSAEMATSRVTITTFIHVLLFSETVIYGAEMEMKVRPGDNITLYCDRLLTRGTNIVWIRNCSHEHQPSLMIDHKIMYQASFPRFSFLLNSNNNSFDLHITNITASDLGLYYCAAIETKVNEDKSGVVFSSDVYYYGNQITRLSSTESVSSDTITIVSTCPVSDCFFIQTLLISLCSVCVLFCFICVFCFCRKKTTGCENNAEMPSVNVLKVDPPQKHQCELSKMGRLCLHSEVTYRLLPSTPYVEM